MFWMVLYWIVVCFGRIRLVHQLDIRPQKKVSPNESTFWILLGWRRVTSTFHRRHWGFPAGTFPHSSDAPDVAFDEVQQWHRFANRSPSVKVIIIILSPVAFLSTQVLLHQKIEPWYHLIYLFVRTVTSGLASKNLNPILETGKPKIPKLPITHSLDNMKRSGFHQLIWIGLIWFSSPYDLQHFSHQIKRMTGCLHVQIWNGFQEFGRHSHECIWWPRLGLR